jgi:hypothetical protein
VCSTCAIVGALTLPRVQYQPPSSVGSAVLRCVYSSLCVCVLYICVWCTSVCVVHPCVYIYMCVCVCGVHPCVLYIRIYICVCVCSCTLFVCVLLGMVVLWKRMRSRASWYTSMTASTQTASHRYHRAACDISSASEGTVLTCTVCCGGICGDGGVRACVCALLLLCWLSLVFFLLCSFSSSAEIANRAGHLPL